MQLRSQRRLGTWNVLRLETLIDRDPPVGVTEGNAGNTQVRQDILHLSESALPKSRFCIQAIVLGVVLTLVMVGLLGFLAFFTRRSLGSTSLFLCPQRAFILRERSGRDCGPSAQALAEQSALSAYAIQASPGCRHAGETHARKSAVRRSHPIHLQLVLQQSLRRAIWLSSFHDGHRLVITHFVP